MPGSESGRSSQANRDCTRIVRHVVRLYDREGRCVKRFLKCGCHTDLSRLVTCARLTPCPTNKTSTAASNASIACASWACAAASAICRPCPRQQAFHQPPRPLPKQSSFSSSFELPASSILPGAEVHTPFGPAWVRTARYPLAERPDLAEWLTVQPAALAALDRNDALLRLEPAKVAFIDTETTGLSLGAGTYTFLIGVGTFEDGRLRRPPVLHAQPGRGARPTPPGGGGAGTLHRHRQLQRPRLRHAADQQPVRAGRDAARRWPARRTSICSHPPAGSGRRGGVRAAWATWSAMCWDSSAPRRTCRDT